MSISEQTSLILGKADVERADVYFENMFITC
jgi:hypothetical protein